MAYSAPASGARLACGIPASSAEASRSSSAVMKPSPRICASTIRPRERANSALAIGEYFDGAFKSPAMSADSASVRLRAGLPKQRRRIDAEGAAAEVHAVEIELEDVRFRQPRFQPQRQRHLLQLAREGAVGAQ